MDAGAWYVFGVITGGLCSILWRDPSRVDEAAELMRMTADHLLQNNVIDRKFTESPNGIEKDLPYTTDQIAKALAGDVA